MLLPLFPKRRRGGKEKQLELKELVEETMNIFQVQKTEDLGTAVFEAIRNEETEKYDSFCNMTNDLSKDWMQMIFQYYQADRKEKKQDYTPKSLAQLMAKLSGDTEVVQDLCAGSGALTIQKWCMHPSTKFELHEIDDRVIPFLLFNMIVRNIDCTVYHEDVLRQETFHIYRITKGDRYGIFKEV